MRVTASEMRRLLTDMRDADIARHLGVSRERVRQIRARTGIPLPPSTAATRREEAVAALKAGATPAQVAAELGVSRSTVSRYRTAAGFPARRGELAPCGTRTAYARHLRWGETPCGPCREANRLARPGAVAADVRRQRVRQLLAEGRPVDEVAAVTGMSVAWVRRHARAAGLSADTPAGGTTS